MKKELSILNEENDELKERLELQTKSLNEEILTTERKCLEESIQNSMMIKQLALKHENMQEAMKELVMQSERTKEELLEEKMKAKEIEKGQCQNKLSKKIESELR